MQLDEVKTRLDMIDVDVDRHRPADTMTNKRRKKDKKKNKEFAIGRALIKEGYRYRKEAEGHIIQ